VALRRFAAKNNSADAFSSMSPNLSASISPWRIQVSKSGDDQQRGFLVELMA